MSESNNLPFNTETYSKSVESVGTNVLLSDSKEPAIKVAKHETPYTSIDHLVERAEQMRYQEEVAMEIASERTKEAIVPQDYVIAEGSEEGKGTVVRTQPHVDGTPLKKLGFDNIMNLPDEDITTLKSVLLDSMKCYIKHGTNYDLSGSDERDAREKSRSLNLKRLIFPLRNSSNLYSTPNGIKLIDPNVLGQPDSNQSLKGKILQSLLFTSSAADYALLSANQLMRSVFKK